MTHGYYQCAEDGAIVGDPVGPFDGPGDAKADAETAGLTVDETIVFRWSDLEKVNRQLGPPS